MLNNVINEVMVAPLGDMIHSIGKGVGEAQAALDAGSLAQTLAMYSKQPLSAKDGFSRETSEMVKLFKEIGYRPTFYAIPETEVITKISLTMSGQDVTNLFKFDAGEPQPSVVPSNLLRLASITTKQALSRLTLQKIPVQSYVAPVNAGTANKYNIDLEAAATLRFKIVPVPTPVYVENLLDNDLIDDLLDKVDEDVKKEMEA